MKIIHTDGYNKDFINLCKLLDENLDEIVGGLFDRDKFTQYNLLDDINKAVIIYIDNVPVACGSFKHYQDSIAEIKRIFVHKDYRGKVLSKIVMKELELLAIKDGYQKLILETGELLATSMKLYKSIGFKIIRNYGPYIQMEESVCMEKIL